MSTELLEAEQNEEILDFGQENPYRVSDDEFAPVYEQFHRMVYWQAKLVAERIGRKFDQDFIDDTAQDIFMSVMRCMEKYKRQKFIVQCYHFLKGNPDLIPAAHYNKALSAIWYWQMRAKLGPRHGFSPVHDGYLADAIDAIHTVALDFEYSHAVTCLSFLDNMEDEVREALAEEAHILDDFKAALEKNDLFQKKKLGARLNEKASVFSPFGVRPCRWRPFVMDEEFGPYVKKFIINHGNKSVKRRPQHDLVPSVPIDEMADILADTRRSTANLFHTNQMNHLRRRVSQQNDSDLSRTFAVLEEGESGGGLYQETISMKGLKRRLQLSEMEIRGHIEVIKALAEESGGLEQPIDPLMMRESLQARTGTAMDHKFEY